MNATVRLKNFDTHTTLLLILSVRSPAFTRNSSQPIYGLRTDGPRSTVTDRGVALKGGTGIPRKRGTPNGGRFTQ